MELLPNTVVQRRRSTEVPKRVHVLLVDGSIITLHGLKSYLSESNHIIVVGTARTEQAALTALKICQPDVVVLGVRVGRASGIDICRVMRESYPKIAVLFFSEYDDKHVLQSAILAGAQGYLLEIASREALVKSIELVATGRGILDPQLTRQVMNWIRDGGRGATHKTVQELSGQDQKILSLVAAGKTNKEIAQELQIAQTLIAARLQKLYKRLQVSRRTEATSYFVRLAKGPVKYLDCQYPTACSSTAIQQE